MANLYCSSVFYAQVAQWTASTQVSVGQIVRQRATQSFGNERCFRCITAGTTGSSEPGWDRGRNGQTQDNSARWQECTGQEAYQGTDGTWRAPHCNLNAATNNWSDGDTVFVDYQHRMLYTGTGNSGMNGKGNTNNPNFVYSVDPAVSFPPTLASLRVGGREQTEGGSYQVNGSLGEVWGLTLIAGASTSTNYVEFQIGWNNNCHILFNRCTLGIGSTGSNSNIKLSEGSGVKAVFRDLTVSFAHTSHSISLRNNVDLYGLKLAEGSVVPTLGLFTFSNGNSSTCNIEAADFTFLGTNPILSANAYPSASLARLIRCKLSPNSAAIISQGGFGVPIAELIACDSGTVFNRFERFSYMGSQVVERSLVRTGGSADLRQPQSYKVATVPNNANMTPFEMGPLAAIITTPGSYTLTVEGIWDGAALPTQADLTMRVGYQPDVGSTLGASVSTERASRWHPANAYPASTEAWDSKVPARANGTSYATGALVSLKSNPGRVFICTSGGNSASSEPAGYASAVDGGTVSDGNATFRAMVRFKVSVSLPNAQIGVADVALKMGKASANYWIDFVPVLT